MRGSLDRVSSELKGFIGNISTSIDKVSSELRGSLDRVSSELNGFTSNVSTSNEIEVVSTVHRYLSEILGTIDGDEYPIPPPVYGHKGYSRKRMSLYELDGLIYVGGEAVVIIEVKSHVTIQTIHQVRKTTSIFLSQSRGQYTHASLFIGGPLITKKAKSFALWEGINVVEVSRAHYYVLVASDGLPKERLWMTL